jgi:crossover junction endodeoxyribonuclease RuvC
MSRIYHGLLEVLLHYKPQAVSLEKVFLARNPQSALKLGQARGVALLASSECGVSLYEYSSSEIKLAVVGYGRAGKAQVQKMVAFLLHLPSRIPEDAADALAAGICHLHQRSYHARITPERPSSGQSYIVGR